MGFVKSAKRGRRSTSAQVAAFVRVASLASMLTSTALAAAAGGTSLASFLSHSSTIISSSLVAASSSFLFFFIDTNRIVLSHSSYRLYLKICTFL